MMQKILDLPQFVIILRIMYNDVNNIKLRDIAEISAGYALRGSASKLKAGETALIQLRNASGGTQIDWNNVEHVTLPSNKKTEYLNEGDIIFSARGTQTFAYYIPERPHQSVCAPQFFVLTPKRPKQYSPKYLAWFLNAAPAQHYFESVAVGTAMKNIRRSAVENLEVSLPSLHRQEAIVNLWETAIAEKDTLRALISNRTNLLNGIAQELSRQGA